MIATESLRGQSTYLDSNILIYFLETPIDAPDQHHPFLRGLFRDIKMGLSTALTSQLTLAEVLVIPLRESDIKLERAYRGMLRGTPNFPVVPISLEILNKTAEIRARHKGAKIAMQSISQPLWITHVISSSPPTCVSAGARWKFRF